MEVTQYERGSLSFGQAAQQVPKEPTICDLVGEVMNVSVRRLSENHVTR